MKGILKMLFLQLMHKSDTVQDIENIGDLCEVSYCKDKIIEIFAVMNDDQDGFSTAEILSIANEAYQEVWTK